MMAKKMRPRRPVKKTAKVVGRKKRYKSKYRANKAEAVLRASLRKIDPFYLDEKLIPVGWSYQWVPRGTERREGWTEVPYSRHAHDFPHTYACDGHIICGGQVLIEGRTELARSSIAKDHDAAREMERWFKEKYGMGGPGPHHGGYHMLLPESEIVTTVLKDAPPAFGPPIETPISLLIRIPQRWVAAAAYLNLTVSEYARRRVVGERLVLGCMDGRIGDLDATYEPVNLQFSPNKEVQ